MILGNREKHLNGYHPELAIVTIWLYLLLETNKTLQT